MTQPQVVMTAAVSQATIIHIFSLQHAIEMPLCTHAALRQLPLCTHAVLTAVPQSINQLTNYSGSFHLSLVNVD